MCLIKSSQNMKLLVLATVFLFQLTRIKEVNAEILVPQRKDNYAECFGSLLVVTENGFRCRIQDSVTQTRFKVNSLEVEGCGCFELYKRENFGGTVRPISHYMGYVSSDYIGFTVRSVEKVPCEEYGQHPWLLRRTVTRDARHRHRGHRLGQILQVPTIECVMP